MLRISFLIGLEFFPFSILLRFPYSIVILFLFSSYSIEYKYVYSLLLFINQIKEFIFSLHGIIVIKRLGTLGLGFRLGFSHVVNSSNLYDDHVSFQSHQTRY